jgi:hypothetical protein
MATVMSMYWPEVTKEQYEEAGKLVDWVNNRPDGGRLHVAWMAEDGFRVVDVWDSPEQFQKFVETRLRPGVEKIGIQGQPQVTFHEFLGAYVPQTLP